MTNTRRLSTIAILSAISFVLMYFDFPLLPAASFLKLEFSILPVLVGLVVMDLPAALGILLLRSLLKLLLNSQGVNTYIGLPMNIVALGVFVIVFALIWKKERTTLRFLLGSLAGTIGLTVAMWAFCVSRARTAALSKSSPSFRAVIGFVLSGVR